MKTRDKGIFVSRNRYVKVSFPEKNHFHEKDFSRTRGKYYRKHKHCKITVKDSNETKFYK